MRRFSTAFIEVCRGQGKSTMAAGLALYLGFFDGESAAENYCVATKRDQSKIVFETARQMVLASPALQRRLTVQQHNIHNIRTVSKLEALGADANTLDGLRPHICIADEVHAHPSPTVLDVMKTGMGTRLQPLMFEITTAGLGRESVWWAHRDYSRQILEQARTDSSWFTFIACADDEDDWTLESTWRKANPNYGVSVKPEYLATEARKAQAMIGYQNTFRRLHVGQLVEQETRYLSMEQWNTPEASAPIDLDALEGRVCYGGLDLSTTTDLSAFVLLWEDGDGGYTCVPWFWVPGENIMDRSRADHVPYDAWSREGYLTATPGSVVDYSYIFEAVTGLGQRFKPYAIGFDPWNATDIVRRLTESNAPMVKVSQSIAMMTAPTKELARLVSTNKLRHGGHPVLRWNAANLTVVPDSNGNMKPDKSRRRERIDGMSALLNALSLAMSTQRAAEPQYQLAVFGRRR